jgi:hypothetical protein
MSDLLPGHVQERRVKCGKSNCKCAKGEPHIAYYHVWHEGGKRFQRYIKKSHLEAVRKACRENRTFQTQLRVGRTEYKQMLARARDLFGHSHSIGDTHNE